ncbi:putative quinol monooxygenase [Gordonia sp. PS3]|uniref:ABM domain-containing protein n=1 Tax=Gordonia sihwensis NBRC 108236 TaxID=1223544 RepID=L7LH26_9ACTN|nr:MULTISPECIES: antibiotic biosynthesis monooxygenase [Gordonia]AUH68334.1 antibiotic biosynthesis monooxygenase [Gordonia sp. YC-JH1]GAC60415.1 hypothetical protein GSI01S_10_00070 [Gordonia sihwensis NBRC 108236]
MTEVVVSGRLICGDDAQTAIVERLLPRHVELTRAEPGCVAFSVLPTSEPGVWAVDETFVDAAAFRAHQRRVASSEWGRMTAGIERVYTIQGS